jgi:hypothetical protein
MKKTRSKKSRDTVPLSTVWFSRYSKINTQFALSYQTVTQSGFQVAPDQTQAGFPGVTKSSTVWLSYHKIKHIPWLPGITGSNIALLLRYYKIKHGLSGFPGITRLNTVWPPRFHKFKHGLDSR